MSEQTPNVDLKVNEIVEKVVETPELLDQVLQSPVMIERVAMMVQQQVSHSGPLPMADEVRKYNEIIPNGADRIMKLAENEQRNRYAIPNYSTYCRF